MGYAAINRNYINGQPCLALSASTCCNAGTYAEFATIKSSLLASIPDNISFDEAAAVPLVSLTAMQAGQAIIHKAACSVLSPATTMLALHDAQVEHRLRNPQNTAREKAMFPLC